MSPGIGFRDRAQSPRPSRARRRCGASTFGDSAISTPTWSSGPTRRSVVRLYWSGRTDATVSATQPHDEVTRMSIRRILVGICLAVMVSACGRGEVSSAPSPPDSSVGDDGASSAQMVDGGSWYVHEQWPHDGQPVESEGFVVYSDGASPEARQEMAEAAERLWVEVLDELEVTQEMLQFPLGQEKIDIYAYHDRFPQGWSGRAYYGGLLMWSPDHPLRQFDSSGYEPTLKHELIHVLQWMLTGGQGSIDTWFIEGLPLALADDPAHQTIGGIDQLNDLTSEYGSINPISIKQYSQITDPEAGEHFYSPMFRLAFDYLLDDGGLGRSPADARDVMLDLAVGGSFEVAFGDHMGLGLDDFEEQFFDLMNEYLR